MCIQYLPSTQKVSYVSALRCVRPQMAIGGTPATDSAIAGNTSGSRRMPRMGRKSRPILIHAVVGATRKRSLTSRGPFSCVLFNFAPNPFLGFLRQNDRRHAISNKLFNVHNNIKSPLSCQQTGNTAGRINGRLFLSQAGRNERPNSQSFVLFSSWASKSSMARTMRSNARRMEIRKTR